MQPRIFISHSAKDSATSALLSAMEEKLSAQGFYVLVDRTRLKIEGVGTDWRATLNQWLAICDGAVLLISPDAVKSPWVHAESTILNYRHHHDRLRGVDFPLLIVHTCGTVPDQIAGPEFGISSLDHIQSIRGDDLAFVFETATRMFAPLLLAAQRSEKSDLCFDICRELGACSDESLVRASEALEKDVSNLHAHADKATTLAYLLMGAQLNEAATALVEIWTRRRPEQDNIIKLLEPSWADTRSVEWLVDDFVKIEPPRTALVSAARVDSVSCHVDRAQRRNPSIRWICTVVPKLGDREPQDCIAKLKDHLANKLRMESSTDVMADIRAAIEIASEQKYPFVFIFPSTDVYEQVGAALQQAFGSISCIVLNRDGPGAMPPGAAAVEIPYVVPSREDAFWRDRLRANNTLASLRE